MSPPRGRAPQGPGDLNDEQLARWREGDQSVWSEDFRGRKLTPEQVRRDDERAARRAERLLPIRELDLEAGS